MFEPKRYKHEFYLRNKTRYTESARKRYLQKRPAILARRKELFRSESPEKREKRLAFHRKYNVGYRTKNRELSQSDEYKFRQYRFAAHRRNYDFSLSEEEFLKIYHSDCSYCGLGDCRGIDRIDNTAGYTIENSTGCCEMCNKMKWRYSKGEFLSHVKTINTFINEN